MALGQGAFALASAQWQVSWNTRVRALGLGASVALGVLLALAAGTTGLGMTLLMAVLGWLGGRQLPGEGSLVALHVGAAVLCLGAPVVNALLGAGRAIDAQSLRRFPLRAWEVVLVELAARAGDPVALAVLLMLGAAGLSMAVACPQAALPIALTCAWSLSTYVVLELVVTQVVSASLKSVGRFALLAAVMLGGLFWRPSSKVGDDGSAHFFGDFAWAWLPSSWGLEAARALVHGNAPLAAGLLAMQGAVLACLVAAVVALTLRETRGANPRASKGAASVWSFEAGWAGVARLQWAILWDSHWGRFVLVVPLLIPLVFRVVFSPFASSVHAPVFMLAYVGMATVALSVNQFGFEGAAVGGLFVLPVKSQDLWLGKRLCLQLVWAVQSAFAAVVFTVTIGGKPSAYLSGLLVGWGIFLIQNTLGQYLSVWVPRSFPKRSLRQPRIPFLVGLVNFAVIALGVGGFGAMYAVVFQRSPLLVVPVLALLVMALEVVWWARLPHATRLLDSRREHIVLSMK